jgi:hypothetical protein
VTLPAGTFAVDAMSSGAYDHQNSVWLPTTYGAISPDGSRYTYAEPAVASTGGPPAAGVVHVVNVVGGADHVARTPGPVSVIAWTANGIYVESIIPQSGAPPVGLTVINPDTLTFRQITSLYTWQAVNDHYAYTTDIDPADPSPPQPNGPGPIPGDRIQRLDLTTEALAPMLTINGATVSVEGFDSSQNPVVSANTASAFTVRLTPSNQQIFSGPSMTALASDPAPSGALGDSTGIWFNSAAGVIWHFGPADTTIHQVAVTGLPFAGLAGPCT